ncbi:hypothetical protein H8B15_03960 [Hymenobacter sp. BT507]|uniref:Nuclear transport factor 2 family protein n=1 Tax=Hymenobacter citatus TaxID=2763506 RepID=A0ABR7MHL3_9BACT|nr:hypothetical protein [Hymenobacter citatus]MBC6610063.1 hypothetical protein [Hymenobacter citatus]
MITTARVLILFVLIFLFYSCKGQSTNDIPQFKKNNDLVYSAKQIKVYNDILNDLIKNHFYGYYLGDASDTLYSKNNRVRTDTSAINTDARILTLALLSDSTKLCTIYLNEDPASEKILSWKIDMNTSYGQKIENMLKKYSDNVSGIITKLSMRQSLYKSKDFHSSIARISSVYNMKEYNIDTRTIRGKEDKCVVGIVSLSNIVLNKNKDKGIMYYEFYCGGRCGRGELAEIEQVDGRWHIVNTEMFWIS